MSVISLSSYASSSSASPTTPNPPRRADVHPLTSHPSSASLNDLSSPPAPDSIRKYSYALKARMTLGWAAALKDLKDEPSSVLMSRKTDPEFGYDENPIDLYQRNKERGREMRATRELERMEMQEDGDDGRAESMPHGAEEFFAETVAEGGQGSKTFRWESDVRMDVNDVGTRSRRGSVGTASSTTTCGDMLVDCDAGSNGQGSSHTCSPSAPASPSPAPSGRQRQRHQERQQRQPPQPLPEPTASDPRRVPSAGSTPFHQPSPAYEYFPMPRLVASASAPEPGTRIDDPPPRPPLAPPTMPWQRQDSFMSERSLSTDTCTPGSTGNWSDSSFEAVSGENYFSMYGGPGSGAKPSSSRSTPAFDLSSYPSAASLPKASPVDRSSFISAMSFASNISIASSNTITSLSPVLAAEIATATARTAVSGNMTVATAMPALVTRPSRPVLGRPRPRAHPYDPKTGVRQRELSNGSSGGSVGIGAIEEEQEWLDGGGRTLSEQMVVRAGRGCQRGRGVWAE